MYFSTCKYPWQINWIITQHATILRDIREYKIVLLKNITLLKNCVHNITVILLYYFIIILMIQVWFFKKLLIVNDTN